jgi:hypothetical protein
MTRPALGRGLLNWIRRRRHSVVTGTAPVTSLSDVRQLVCELDLPATITPDDLAARLSTVRRRPIKIQPYPDKVVAESRRLDEPLPYGVWVPAPTVDYVFFRQNTTHTHRQHIVLHELGHIVCRHVGEQAGTGGAPDHQMIRRAVKRTSDFAEN